MQPAELSALIAKQPVFADLEPKYLALLADCGHHARHHAGEYVFDEGKPSTDLMIVSDGSVALEQFGGDIGNINIETLTTGDVLSFAWLIPPHVNWLSAQAKTRVDILVFNGMCLRGKCLEDPRFGYELILCMTKVAADRLTHTRQKLLQEIGV